MPTWSPHVAAHDLLEVLVLERHRVEVGDLPRLAGVRELALPHAVAPLGVHVADALHAEADERLEVDVLATAVGVDERDPRRGRRDACRAGSRARARSRRAARGRGPRRPGCRRVTRTPGAPRRRCASGWHWRPRTHRSACSGRPSGSAPTGRRPGSNRAGSARARDPDCRRHGSPSCGPWCRRHASRRWATVLPSYAISPSHLPNWAKRVTSMIGRRPWFRIWRPSSTHAVRAVNVRSAEMPESFSSMATRMRRIGSSTSISNGPMRRSVGSSGARRDAWNACCSPSRTMLRPQSRMPRFGYSAAPMPK